MDLILEMLAESHPLYFYVGMFVTVYCTYQLHRLHFSKPALYSNNDYWRAMHAHKTKMNVLIPPLTGLEAVHEWLALKMKRTDLPDDDGEPSSSLTALPTSTVNKEEENEKICIRLFETV